MSQAEQNTVESASTGRAEVERLQGLAESITSTCAPWPISRTIDDE
jgi:hypothetical protein